MKREFYRKQGGETWGQYFDRQTWTWPLTTLVIALVLVWAFR